MIFLLFQGQACAPKEPEPELSLSQELYSLPSWQNAVSIFVTSNYDWTASASSPWIVLSTTGGAAGKTTLSFQVEANDDVNERTGSITIRCGTLSKTVTIIQGQKDVVIVSGEKTLEFQADGGLLSVELQSNIDYDTFFPDWITAVSTKALTKHTHMFSVSGNETSQMRTGEIIFKNKSNAASDTILIRQFSRYSLLGIRHSASVITVPTISGASPQGTIDWGDGESDSYRPSLSHTYDAVWHYLVKIELEAVSRVTFSDLTDIDAIDFSRF